MKYLNSRKSLKKQGHRILENLNSVRSLSNVASDIISWGKCLTKPACDKKAQHAAYKGRASQSQANFRLLLLDTSYEDGGGWLISDTVPHLVRMLHQNGCSMQANLISPWLIQTSWKQCTLDPSEGLEQEVCGPCVAVLEAKHSWLQSKHWSLFHPRKIEKGLEMIHHVWFRLILIPRYGDPLLWVVGTCHGCS